MTIEEMREIEWLVPWSGGKDSTATIILMHENNIPIKAIEHVMLMYDDNTPAALPEMNIFRTEAAAVFNSWGYTVNIYKGKRTAKDVYSVIYHRSKYEIRNNTPHGIISFARGMCGLEKYKEISLPNDYIMLGYAADETARFKRLNDKKQSILLTLGITEKDALSICEKYNLLSPLYKLGFGRDGCFFCPNKSKKEREYIRNNYPELYNKILDIIYTTDPAVLNTLADNFPNEWLRDYFKERGFRG